MQDTSEVAAKRNAILMQFVLKSLRGISLRLDFIFNWKMAKCFPANGTFNTEQLKAPPNWMVW